MPSIAPLRRSQFYAARLTKTTPTRISASPSMCCPAICSFQKHGAAYRHHHEQYADVGWKRDGDRVLFRDIEPCDCGKQREHVGTDDVGIRQVVVGPYRGTHRFSIAAGKTGHSPLDYKLAVCRKQYRRECRQQQSHAVLIATRSRGLSKPGQFQTLRVTRAANQPPIQPFLCLRARSPARALEQALSSLGTLLPLLSCQRRNSSMPRRSPANPESSPAWAPSTRRDTAVAGRPARRCPSGSSSFGLLSSSFPLPVAISNRTY